MPRMALRVLCCFSYQTGQSGWTDEHFCVTHFVRALKELPLRGYAYVPVARDAPRRRLDQSNATQAVEWFGILAAEMCGAAGLREPLQFVPVPNSSCIIGTAASRTKRLADALAVRMPNTSVRDAMRFDSAVKSARSEHGLRDAVDVFERLRLVEQFDPNTPVVLVDDTVASGGHLAAAKARVELAGGAIVVPGATSEETTLQLEPGTYEVVCFVPAATDQRPHFDHGMHRTLVVD